MKHRPKSGVDFKLRITEEQHKRAAYCAKHLGVPMVRIAQEALLSKLKSVEEEIEQEKAKREAEKRASFVPTVPRNKKGFGTGPVKASMPSPVPAPTIATQAPERTVSPGNEEYLFSSLALYVECGLNEAEQERRANKVSEILVEISETDEGADKMVRRLGKFAQRSRKE